MENLLKNMGIKAKESARVLAGALSAEKDKAIFAIADAVEANAGRIISANEKDLENARKSGISPAMIDRLALDMPRINALAGAVREVGALKDPVGVILGGDTRPNGLKIIKQAVPLGVIGLIYESRPNVTVDTAVLCLKSGNACILRGGSEAVNSNKVLADILRTALEESGLPKDSVQLIENTDREYANALMTLSGYVDALIPRGGKGLIQAVVKNSTVPVIETGAGMCHIYVDEFADIFKAAEIIVNAKTSRPSVCNAVETVLVHQSVAAELFEKLIPEIAAVEIYGCSRTKEILGERVKPATEENWSSEYNDYILNIKIVSDIMGAISHIEKYSTKHSEAIVTENYSNAQLFQNSVDSACVYLNASTRFTDGGEFGLGAEIGISTQKLHVRGPMGLEALTSSKYVIYGNGQIR